MRPAVPREYCSHIRQESWCKRTHASCDFFLTPPLNPATIVDSNASVRRRSGSESRADQETIEEAMAYPGGKAGAGVFQKIINQFPPHDVYCEPFLGAAAVMLRKRPGARTIGVEIDPGVAARFRGDATESTAV